MPTVMPIRTRLAAGLVTAGLAASLAAVSAAPAGATSAHPAPRAGKYAVSAKVNQTEPVLGDLVKLRGTVTPAAPGQKVQLEVLYANRKDWKTIGSDTLSAASKFTLKDKVGSVRVRKYRVVKAPGSGHTAGHSRSIKVTVFGWRTLTSLRAANVVGMYPTSSASINGVAYPNSLWSYNTTTASVDYNLNHGCKTLQSTYGLDDSSPSGATATLAVAVDGVTRFSSQAFGLTQSAQSTLDVTGAFRVTFASTVTGAGHAVVASPMVLCDF